MALRPALHLLSLYLLAFVSLSNWPFRLQTLSLTLLKKMLTLELILMRVVYYITRIIDPRSYTLRGIKLNHE